VKASQMQNYSRISTNYCKSEAIFVIGSYNFCCNLSWSSKSSDFVWFSQKNIIFENFAKAHSSL